MLLDFLYLPGLFKFDRFLLEAKLVALPVTAIQLISVCSSHFNWGMANTISSSPLVEAGEKFAQ